MGGAKKHLQVKPPALWLAILLWCGTPTAHAQTPLPDDFNPGISGFMPFVYSLGVQLDGKILAGGSFATLGGQSHSGVGRVYGDGTPDSSFNSGAGSLLDGAVFSLTIQPDGKVLVGGTCTSPSGQTLGRIARFNLDGTLDTGFNPAADAHVFSLVVQADGKILVGGGFTTLNGQPFSRIGRLNADGTLDTSFGAGTDYDPYTGVYAMALQADGKILVGGTFTKLGGERRDCFARLNPDGTLDDAFNPGADNVVNSLAVQTDGKILVGGYFITLGGQRRNRIARLNTNGTVDSGFRPDANGPVSSFALQADGKILVAGDFTTLNGQPRSRIARLNANGTLDDTFNPGADNSVRSVVVQADGSILVGGYFTTLGGQPRDYVGRLTNTESATQSLNYDGSTITWLRGGTSPEVWQTTFEVSTNGGEWFSLGAGSRIPGLPASQTGGWRLIGVSLPRDGFVRARGCLAGGYPFVEAQAQCGTPSLLGEPAERWCDAGADVSFGVVAAGFDPLGYQWLKDGVPLWDGWNLGGAATARLMVASVLRGDEGAYQVVVSNFFGSVTSTVARLTVTDPVIAVQPVSQNCEPGQNIALSVTAAGTPPLVFQWWKDGAVLAGATGTDLTMTGLQVTDAGEYWVAVSNQYGSVTSAVVEVSVNLVTLDGGFSPGGDGSVYSLAVQADGKILVGGLFSTVDGQPRTNIARLNVDGTLDSEFNPGADEGVYSLTVQTDDKILVGGWFTTLDGQPRAGVGRLNVDGTMDSEFNPGADGYVSSLVVQANGKILVGGRFTTLGGQQFTSMARLNEDGTLDGAFHPQADGYVRSVAVQADGKILVGGDFTIMAGQPCNRIARLNEDGSLDSEFKPEADDTVGSLAIQADGKILVGGYFTTLGGQPRNCIGRLRADGSLDSGFNPGADGKVNCLVAQTDGKILVGGYYVTLGGCPRANLARLNQDGSLDSGFNPGADDNVNALVVQEDGRILAGGDFTMLVGRPCNHIGQMNNTSPASQSLGCDGAIITWLRGGSSPEVCHTSLEVCTNGSEWIPLGMGSRVLASLDGQGSGWQWIGPCLPHESTLRVRGRVPGGYQNASGWLVETCYGKPGFLSQPTSRTNDPGTSTTFKVSAAGSETVSFRWFKDGGPLVDEGNLAGTAAAVLVLTNVQWTEAGSYSVVASNAFGSVTSVVARLAITELLIITQPVSQNREPGQSVTLNVSAAGASCLGYQWWKDGVALAGAGEASLALTNLQAGDAGQYRVVVSSQYGSVTSAVALLTVNLVTPEGGFNPVADNSVYALAVQADGKVLVGGVFSTLDGQPRSRIGRLNADGTVDTAFNPGASGSIYSLAVQADGKILVGGSFLTLRGWPRTNLARLNLDGTLDSGFNPGTDGSVSSLLVQPDGKILVGGAFTTLCGWPRNALGRLNVDGTLDRWFDPKVDGTVNSVAVQANGCILAGGAFTTLGGQPRTNIGGLNSDGTLGAGFDQGTDGLVRSLVMQADGKILVGGAFTTLGGQPRSRMGRLNEDGTLDLMFNPGASSNVYSLAVQADKKIVACGSFTTLCGQPRSRMARLNEDGTLDSVFNPGANSDVYSLAVQADGKLLAGGRFTTIGAQAHSRIGRMDNTGPITQSFSYDGSTIVWLRGGASPEVWRATFEASVDGVIWSGLGAGQRIPGLPVNPAGGWQLSGASLPPHGTLRARGYLSGGYGNASGWFIESVLPVFTLLRPAILTGDGSFGVISNRFGFNVRAANGQVVLVETSSDLLHWTSSSTNAVGGSGQVYFSDGDGAGTPVRFYRARLWP